MLADGIDIGGEFHAARLAAATGVDLCLDHHRGAEFFGGATASSTVNATCPGLTGIPYWAKNCLP